jgi:hypothetical protein
MRAFEEVAAVWAEAGQADGFVLGRESPHRRSRYSSRAVGNTLLLKGLEADVSVILDATELDARHLYVAMTRGSKRLVVCAKSAVLAP